MGLQIFLLNIEQELKILQKESGRRNQQVKLKAILYAVLFPCLESYITELKVRSKKTTLCL